MSKVISIPQSLLPDRHDNSTRLFVQYAARPRRGVGGFAKDLPQKIRRKGFCVDEVTWDFLTIALSVSAADREVLRGQTPDGWTREIDLEIYVCKPQIWNRERVRFERMLRLLTGDFWRLKFSAGGTPPPTAPTGAQVRRHQETYSNANCIALLSGGMDSLIGCIDLASEGMKPIFVSHIVPSNREMQKKFAEEIDRDAEHFQWNQSVHVTGAGSEKSTRGRSIVFFAFAALASCAIRRAGLDVIPIYVSENGFISLNIALNPGRIGSFSTKTTHPVYMRLLQEIWDDVGIKCRLILPYKFKTKGEMIAECRNRGLLSELLRKSTSCSRFGTHGRRHCGRCVPCMVRAAAFLKARDRDRTVYKFADASLRRRNAADDVGAMAGVCLRSHSPEFKAMLAGDFLFADPAEKASYVDVFVRGLREVEDYLGWKGIL